MFFKCIINDLIILDFYIVRKFEIGVLVHRGKGNRGFGLSGNLSSGSWRIGDIAIGLLVYRGICYRGFGSSGILLSGF